MPRFKYVLFVFVLALLWIAPMGYTDDAEQSNKELTPTEQASEETETAEPQSITTQEETAPQIKPEKQDIEDSKQSSTTSAASSETPFAIYAIIFGVVALLSAGVTLFLQIRRIRQLRDKLEHSVQVWNTAFNNSEKSWEQLSQISQESRETTDKLEQIVSTLSKNRDELEEIQNALSTIDESLSDNVLPITNDSQKIDQETREKIWALVRAYENGEPIVSVNPVEFETSTPSQNTLWYLNQIAFILNEWQTELKNIGTPNQEIIRSLGNANQIVKDRLKNIRGQLPPLSTCLDMDIDNKTYLSCFEGVLRGYQLGCTIDESEYNRFIPEFIKDRLFNSVVNYIQFDQPPEQLEWLLGMVDYEIIPIEIGKTEADARIHNIQGSQQTNERSGTIVQVVAPGLRRKSNSEIVQKPIVIRGE